MYNTHVYEGQTLYNTVSLNKIKYNLIDNCLTVGLGLGLGFGFGLGLGLV